MKTLQQHTVDVTRIFWLRIAPVGPKKEHTHQVRLAGRDLPACGFLPFLRCDAHVIVYDSHPASEKKISRQVVLTIGSTAKVVSSKLHMLLLCYIMLMLMLVFVLTLMLTSGFPNRTSSSHRTVAQSPYRAEQ